MLLCISSLVRPLVRFKLQTLTTTADNWTTGQLALQSASRTAGQPDERTSGRQFVWHLTSLKLGGLLMLLLVSRREVRTGAETQQLNCSEYQFRRRASSLRRRDGKRPLERRLFVSALANCRS